MKKRVQTIPVPVGNHQIPVLNTPLNRAVLVAIAARETDDVLRPQDIANDVLRARPMETPANALAASRDVLDRLFGFNQPPDVLLARAAELERD